MKRYTVSGVRERLSEALDEAARGIPVIIERKGVRYRLSLEAAPPRARAATRSRIEILDPAVAAGDWSWDSTADGFEFRSGRT